MHEQPESLKGIRHWCHVDLHAMNDVVVIFQSTIDCHCHVLPSSLQDITSMFIEGRFYRNWIFARILLKSNFPLKQIYRISSIKNLITKTDFYYQFRMCIFRSNFFGIRFTTCFTVSNFLFWRYLRLCPFVDCIGNIFYNKIIFLLLYFCRQKFYVQFFPACVLSIMIVLYASSFPCIYFRFFFVRINEVVLLRFDSSLCVEIFCLPKENKKILSSTPLFYSFQNLIIH